MLNFKQVLLSCAFAASLPGCEQPTPAQLDVEGRFEECREVMKLWIVEASINERDWESRLAGCHIAARELSLEQWKCVHAGMKTGEKYVAAVDRCKASG